MQAVTTRSSETGSVVQFDARPLIAQGIEPLTQILESAQLLADGGRLEVIAPFEPVPLYEVLRVRGFRVGACSTDQDAGAWTTTFTRVDIKAEHTVAVVLSRHPNTRESLSHFGLDTCCGANLSLQQASDSRGVALEALLSALTREAVR